MFTIFFVSTFLCTFAAAKSNEEEGKDIVRYKDTKIQRYKRAKTDNAETDNHKT